MIDVAVGLVIGLAVNILVFPPLQLRPAEHAVASWGEDIASALDDLSDIADGQHSDGKFWLRHDRQLTEAAEQARGAARRARESLRWNPRARTHQSVPRPDGAVLDALEEVTARTRAIARWLADSQPADDCRPLPAPFLAGYARLLRLLADAIRRLADVRAAGPDGDVVVAASACQDQVEQQAAQLPGHSDVQAAAHRLTYLSGQMIATIAEEKD